MKNIFICGDSFAYTDPEYGVCWVDILANLLDDQTKLINLSSVCASNLAIGIQVNHAIANQADYIIYLATSSVRNDIAFQKIKSAEKSFDRYTDIVKKDKTKDLASYSIQTIANASSLFTSDQLTILKQYHCEFFDIDLSIEQNHLLIEGTLSLLESSGIPFSFDQGGFENKKYTNLKSKNYFKKYKKYFSGINLWDYVSLPPIYRPYYHIIDPQVHQDIALHYYKLISNAK